MKRVLAVILLLSSVSIALASQDWTRFSPEGGRFSLLTPVKLEESTKTVNDPKLGPYTVHLFLGRDARMVYVVAWVDYAPTFKFNIQGELEANRDNLVKGIGATLIESTPISLNRNPGILFTAQTETDFLTSRVYVVGKRPYQLAVLARKGEDHAQEISKFFGSFEVAPAP